MTDLTPIPHPPKSMTIRCPDCGYQTVIPWAEVIERNLPRTAPEMEAKATCSACGNKQAFVWLDF